MQKQRVLFITESDKTHTPPSAGTSIHRRDGKCNLSQLVAGQMCLKWQFSQAQRDRMWCHAGGQGRWRGTANTLGFGEIQLEQKELTGWKRGSSAFKSSLEFSAEVCHECLPELQNLMQHLGARWKRVCFFWGGGLRIFISPQTDQWGDTAAETDLTKRGEKNSSNVN